MNRLVRTPRAFIRSLQISRIRLNIFVEGEVDSYFYDKLCSQELPDPFSYRVIRSDQLATQGQGKTHLLRTFMSMRRNGQLIIDFKGGKSISIFFADKDIDDLRRAVKRSPHLIYTQYYEVENYAFLHGDLIEAVAVTCLRSRADVLLAIPKPEEWPKQASLLWAPWLKLCLAGCFLRAYGVCNYSAPSLVNAGPWLPVDPGKYSRTLGLLRGRSSLSPADFDAKFARLSARVDRHYLNGTQDWVFKGKWYQTLLCDKLKTSGLATGSALNSLPDRLVRSLLQTLDFGDAWADYHRGAVRRVLALID